MTGVVSNRTIGVNLAKQVHDSRRFVPQTIDTVRVKCRFHRTRRNIPQTNRIFIPHPDLPALTPTGKRLAIRTEQYTIDTARMTREGRFEGPRPYVPQMNCVVPFALTALTSVVPSGLNNTLLTTCVCPVSFDFTEPVATSHIKTVWSFSL